MQLFISVGFVNNGNDNVFVFIFNRFHCFSCMRLLSFTFGNVSQSTGKFAQINKQSFGFSCNESYLVFYQNTDNFL